MNKDNKLGMGLGALLSSSSDKNQKNQGYRILLQNAVLITKVVLKLQKNK